MLTVDNHPFLDLIAFTSSFPAPLGDLPAPDWLQALLKPGATAPLQSDDAVRGAVRDLLRHGGYKPTGRGKPASEYLVRAAGDGTLGTINAAVDACNAVSLHSGLPISVVDLDRAREPFRASIAIQGDRYVFNASGQTIDLEGLLCLFDAQGPCANAVKDAQRTKTDATTRRTLTLLWGTKELPGHTERAFTWYRELLERLGATVERVR
ncbi:phenylalanine--tRNA ligase beta subunit-related protein [Corallococcus sp. RDP092CA]|uniref:phenylalanine--tRNA ligase beta subunit-related protein n=1 Tax=Corallococcus sp. RDP092CA TaxID=3109369 RepID=UPI0035ADC37F